MSKSVQNLSIFLLEGNAPFQSYLDPTKDSTNYIIRPDRNIDGLIVIGEDSNKQPSWLDFLQDGSVDPIPNHFNASTRGILFVRINTNVFALTFGYGRFLIKEDLFVRNFGLKTALNGVDPQKLQSVDVTSILNLGLQTRMQSSNRSSRSVFGHEMVNDLLTIVVGTPLQRILGSVITGRDSLSIKPKINFSDLAQILSIVLEVYYNDNYKQEFAWIDDIKQVKGQQLLEQLNADLISALIDPNRQTEVSIAPPEPIDWEKYDCACFGKKGDEMQELELQPLLDSFTDLQDIHLDLLKRRKTYLRNSESEELEKQWKVYDCLVFESTIAGVRYVLTSGVWYEVSFELANKASSFVDTLPESEVIVISAGLEENEGVYNQRLSSSSTSYHCMDKQNVRCEFAKSLIEPCDVITANRQLYNTSAKLDHELS